MCHAFLLPILNSSDPTPILYLLAGECSLHVYSPILDDPSYFQLSSTITPPFSHPDCSTIFPLHASHLRLGVRLALQQTVGPALDDGRKMMLEEIADATRGQVKGGGTLGDLFVGIERQGGGVIVWAVVNIERKPPTALKVWEMLRHDRPLPSNENSVPFPTDPRTFFSLVPTSPTEHDFKGSDLAPPLVLLAQTPSAPLQAFYLSPPSFFDHSPVTSSFASMPNVKHPILGLTTPVKRMVRTPNGRSFLTLGERGECVVYGFEKDKLGIEEAESTMEPVIGRKEKGKDREQRRGHGVWQARARWEVKEGVDLIAIFARGKSLASYDPETSSLSVQYLRPPPSKIAGSNVSDLPSTLQHISLPTSLPSLSPSHALTTLLALSDIDDGVSTSTTLPTTSFIIASTADAYVYLWRLDAGDPTQRGKAEGEPKPTLVSSYALPFDEDDDGSGGDSIGGGGKKRLSDRLRETPAFVLSVDPMGWHQSVVDWKTRTPLQDMLAVVARDGVLTFWSPRLDDREGREGGGTGSKEEVIRGEGEEDVKSWIRTGRVKTGRKDIVLAACSSRKKTAMGRWKSVT